MRNCRKSLFEKTQIDSPGVLDGISGSSFLWAPNAMFFRNDVVNVISPLNGYLPNSGFDDELMFFNQDDDMAIKEFLNQSSWEICTGNSIQIL